MFRSSYILLPVLYSLRLQKAHEMFDWMLGVSVFHTALVFYPLQRCQLLPRQAFFNPPLSFHPLRRHVFAPVNGAKVAVRLEMVKGYMVMEIKIVAVAGRMVAPDMETDDVFICFRIVNMKHFFTGSRTRLV